MRYVGASEEREARLLQHMYIRASCGAFETTYVLLSHPVCFRQGKPMAYGVQGNRYSTTDRTFEIGATLFFKSFRLVLLSSPVRG